MRRGTREGRPRAAPREGGAGGVDALRQAILNQAREQARELLHEAQSEVKAIQQQAEQEAAAIGQEIRDRARHETTLERQRQISAAELELHRRQLVQREEQIARLFAAANERLQALRHSDGYAEILRQLIIEAATALGGGKLIVSANEGDADLLTEGFLASAARDLEPETTLVRSQTFLDGGGGVLVETEDGRLRYDNTFTGRLDRFRDLLRAEAYGILTGDN